MSECIEWPGTIGNHGYGQQYYGGKLRLSHRVAYVKHRGLPISAIDGKVVMHTCDNRRCVNPEHLVLGTQADNMADMARKGRAHGPLPKLRRLTDEDAAAIRAAFVPGSRTHGIRALSRQYGIGRPSIVKILKGRTYT